MQILFHAYELEYFDEIDDRELKREGSLTVQSEYYISKCYRTVCN